MEMNKEYDYSKEGLAENLAMFLGTTVVAQYMAHGYHWNVKGPEFTQFHDFFEDIYESWAGQEDKIAEYIRILGFDAPHGLEQFLGLSCVSNKACSGNPMEMSANLYEANLVLLNCVEDIFNIATAINMQGIADWAAGRMDAHSKWSWQIGTTIGADSMQIQTLPVDMGKSEAEGPILVAAHPEVVATDFQPKTIMYPEDLELEFSQKGAEHGISADKLKVVYRRGASAFSANSAPGTTRSDHAMSRVNAFVALVATGAPKNPDYVQDNDLLPAGHPRAAEASEAPLTASALVAQEIMVDLKSAESYKTPEEAIFAIAEFSGLGYDAIPVFRAAWRRGVNNSESPFNRAAKLAVELYDSSDADLLPKK